MPLLERTDSAHLAHRFLGKSKWKPAFFSREGRGEKEAKGQSEQWKSIDNFLHKSSENGISPGDPSPHRPEPEPQEGEWTVPTVLSREEQERINHPKGRSPRLPGLKVSFRIEADEIIGEGGDEATSPPVVIKKYQGLAVDAKRSSPLHRHESSSPRTQIPPLQAVQPPTQISPPSHPQSRHYHKPKDIKSTVNGGTEELPPDANPIDQEHRDTAVLQETRVLRPPIPVREQNGSTSPQRIDGPHRPASEAHKEIVKRKALQTPQNFQDKSSSEPLDKAFDAISSKPPVNSLRAHEVIPHHRDTIREAQTNARTSKAGAKSLKDAVKFLGNDASGDFSLKIAHCYPLFRLSLSKIDPHGGISLRDWIHAAVWWFLRGRKELEQAVRGTSSELNQSMVHAESDLPVELRQGYLDLAKTWWIIFEVIPANYELFRSTTTDANAAMAIAISFGDSNLSNYVELHAKLTSSMRGLAVSMKRNNRQPPPSLHVTHLDPSIWTKSLSDYPELGHFLRSVNTGELHRDDQMSQDQVPIPITDTKDTCYLGSMFVDLCVRGSNGKAATSDHHLHCVLTILRDKSEYAIQAKVSDQLGSFTLLISEKSTGLVNWDNLRWLTKQRILSFKNVQGSVLELNFFQRDFQLLWNMQNHTVNIQRSLLPSEREFPLCAIPVQNVRYASTLQNETFPSDSLSHCIVRLFERWKDSPDGANKRRMHFGIRLNLITPLGSKDLHHLDLFLDHETPILFSYLRGEDDAPTLLVRVKNVRDDCKLVLSFRSRQERSFFHSHLDGTFIAENESCSDAIPLAELQEQLQSSTAPSITGSATDILASFPWQRLRIISLSSSAAKDKTTSAKYAGHVRIWAECPFGSLVDRLNVNAGELVVRLSVENRTKLDVSWPEHGDATLSLSNSQLDKSQVHAIRSCLGKSTEAAAKKASKLRTYNFPSIQDLHRFMYGISGFRTIYDGTAAGFSISRRRTVVPLHKRLEPSITRLLLLVEDKTTQLLAFFEDFPLGVCMCFMLKSIDRFESFTRSDRYYIRLVDAKFALPKPEDQQAHGFVSLEVLDYPTEHDDIFIAFDTEAERDVFGTALPAEVTKVSRLVSLRK